MSSWQFLLSPSEPVTQNWETSQAAGRGTTQKKLNIKNRIKFIFSWPSLKGEVGQREPRNETEAGWSIFNSEFRLCFPQAVRLAQAVTRPGGTWSTRAERWGVTLNLGLNCCQWIRPEYADCLVRWQPMSSFGHQDYFTELFLQWPGDCLADCSQFKVAE